MALTPYYQTISDSESPCLSEPDLNYTPYQLFCLTTRLMATWPGPGIPRLLLEQVGNRMVQTVRIMQSDVEVPLSTDQQNQLEALIASAMEESPNHCIVFAVQDIAGPVHLPESWVSSVLPSVKIPEVYDSYIEDNYVYMQLDPNSNYQDLYQQLTQSILGQLRDWYQQGAVVATEAFAISWSLQPATTTLNADRTGLYVPTWKDDRFAANPVSFLTSRLHGDTDLRLEVGTNQVTRHYIADTLRNSVKPRFAGDFVLVGPISHLDDARRFAAIIYHAKRTATGYVVTIPVTSTEDANQHLPLNENYVIYSTDDRLRPLTVSYPSTALDLTRRNI